MRRTWAAVVYLVGAMGAIAALMAQVPFQTAQSNLATYANAIGLSALASALPLHVDRWASFIGLVLFMASCAAMVWLKTQPRVAAPLHGEEQKPLPPKFYSRAEKERLGEMYTEVAEFFAFHASEAPGSFWRTLLDLMKAWTAEDHLHFTMQNADLVTKGVVASQESGYFHMALYDPGLTQKKEYLAYQAEMAVILTDRGKEQIQKIQNQINSLNNVILVLKKAAVTGDVVFVDDIVRTTRQLSIDYINQAYAFQGWARDCASRANAKRQELKE